MPPSVIALETAKKKKRLFIVKIEENIPQFSNSHPSHGKWVGSTCQINRHPESGTETEMEIGRVSSNFCFLKQITEKSL